MTGSVELTGDAPERLGYLDGWRALAIVSLLWGHFFETAYINLGAFGVELFFVLSGRLMAEILFFCRIDIGTFVRRRISRIVPALFVFTTATVLFAQLFPFFGKDYSGFADWPSFLAAWLFLYNYYDFFFGGAWWFNHLWSLSVEEHCYMLLAAVVILTTRNRRHATGVALALGFACMISGVLQANLLDIGGHDLYWRTDVRAASVLVPFGLYLALKELLALKAGRWLMWVSPVGFALGFCFSLNSFPEWMHYSLGTLSLSIAVVTLDATAKPLLGLLGTRPLAWLGNVSFSLYLWQQPFYVQRASIGVWLGLAACVILALVSYYTIERPGRTYLNTHWRSDRQRSMAATTVSQNA
ncbi:acyltransferase [Mesorhizobium sp. KR9-304]|uniref:acyltransferase family protein n=1 Tax=Mesorhizobium sp. KR9-304 TaxID=3156614 RepID=UPI0032B3B270